jgi:hypothetical protein
MTPRAAHRYVATKPNLGAPQHTFNGLDERFGRVVRDLRNILGDSSPEPPSHEELMLN